MVLSQDLVDRGFSLLEVDETDFSDYLVIKEACYIKYVDEYFGGWVDDLQLKMQTNEFNEAKKQSCFKKILLNGETVGFFAYDDSKEKIDNISIQMIEKAQNMGVGSYYLNEIISLSEKSKKPIFLQVFKSNPAKKLYEGFGFSTYDETFSHYLMRYNPTV